jgi:hypothetical protein
MAGDGSDLGNVENQEGGGETGNNAMSVAKKILDMSESERSTVLNKLDSQTREKVIKYLTTLESQQKEDDDSEVDMRPYPEKKPPRRDSAK